MRSKIMAVAAGVLTAAGLGLAPSASAAPVEAQAPAASCFGAECNGLDPVAAGCVADSTVQDFAYSETDGVIEIRFSRTCGAEYARLVYSRPGARLQVTGGDGTVYTRTVPSGSTTVVSPMSSWIRNAVSGDTVYISW
ncbi:DUF2690 domain-containing protein [Allostreptomyces psammosilenae]|uniref:DUF2690 domain-containing protein n=1 Tax=Allostreptomyces psammosilenae TaxID=1892865 RepID=A0A853A7G1_9ACTN|nr:DUF2690 domain-containing protein [Allostreptomyces psammosilenae]NYI06601.1 hypothetical protein [Allostreptomyces psammosilenae]